MPTSVRSSTIALCVAARAAVMQRDDLADLPLDRVQRIERGHRLLEHHGDAGAAHLAQLRVGHLQHVAAAKQDLAGRIARRGLRQQAHDGLRGDRLARAGFADQRQRPALLEPEGDAVDDGLALAALRKGDREIAHVDKRRGLAHENVFRGSKASRTASPMKMSSESIERRHREGRDADPRRRQIRLALQQEFAERRRAGRHAEAEKVERGQRADRRIDDERQEGQRRHHRVRQHVLDDDLGVGEPERARRVDIFEIARAQELGAHEMNEADPGEQQQDRRAGRRSSARGSPTG